MITFFQMYRVVGKLSICKLGFENIKKFILDFLSNCCSANDTESIRKIMILTFTFYMEEEKGDKVYLFN